MTIRERVEITLPNGERGGSSLGATAGDAALVATPDTLRAGERARLTLTGDLPPDLLVFLSVFDKATDFPDPTLGRFEGACAEPGEIDPSGTTVAAFADCWFVANGSAGRVDAEVNAAILGVGSRRATIAIGASSLTFVATPDTLQVGAEAALTLGGDVPLETPVTLTLSDEAPGSLAGLCAPPETKTRGASARTGIVVQTTVAAFADCRFVAGDEAGSATLTVGVNGLTLSTTVTVEDSPLVLQVLRQNDDLLSVTSNLYCDCAMVSRYAPSRFLPASTPFTSAFVQSSNGAYDPDTVRPELLGAPEGAAVAFHLDIIRGGQAIPISSDGREPKPDGSNTAPKAVYDAVPERTPRPNPPPDAKMAFRSDQHIRFVSNSRPANAPSGARYDDEVQGFQTVRVELGDQVRFRAEVDGVLIPQNVVLTVGGPQASQSPYAARRAFLAWSAHRPLYGSQADAATAASVITARMSEDHAQNAIGFDAASVNTWSDDLLRNLFTIEFHGASRLAQTVQSADPVVATFSKPQSGTGVTVELVPVIGETLAQTAQRWRVPLASSLGLRPEEVSVLSAEGLDEDRGRVRSVGTAETLYIAFTSREPLRLLSDVRSSDVIVRRERLRASSFRIDELGALGAIVRDRLPVTVDVVVIRDRSLYSGAGRSVSLDPDIWGKAFPDLPLGSTPLPANESLAAANALFLTASAADLRDDRPYVAGHEIGHVLHLQHTTPPNNLMKATTDLQETLSGPKRLTLLQQQQVRTRDGASPVQILN